MKKYRIGLRADIAHDVAMQQITSFGDLVQKSYHAEAGLSNIHKEKNEVNQKKKGLFGKFGLNLKSKGNSSMGKQSHFHRSPKNCSDCGYPHSGECMKGKNMCYYCKQPGHFRNECPRLKKHGEASGSAKNKGRVYSLDCNEIRSNNALIMDICLLGQSKVLVLFDCGAINSFIAVDCVMRLGIPSVPLVPPMSVAVATGGRVTSKKVFQNCPILVGSKVYHIDLICLPLKDFDVVLGMDCLSANTVYIGCAEKNLFIPSETSAESRALSALLQNTHQMIQYLGASSKCFSVLFTVDLESSLSPSDIPIVSEYLDFFLMILCVSLPSVK
jgi:hypothetical protein